MGLSQKSESTRLLWHSMAKMWTMMFESIGDWGTKVSDKPRSGMIIAGGLRKHGFMSSDLRKFDSDGIALALEDELPSGFIRYIAMVFRWPIEIDGLPIEHGDFSAASFREFRRWPMMAPGYMGSACLDGCLDENQKGNWKGDWKGY